MTSPSSKTTVSGTLYDYPKSYDLAFRGDASGECDFLEGCFERHATRPVKRVFEPACGSGRLLIRLAERGFGVSGWDLNRAAINYCNDRFRRRGFRQPAVRGDIVRVSLPTKVDAAFSMISSFQLLLTEQAAHHHLRSLASNIAKGGIYILGFHLMPSQGRIAMSERSVGTLGRLSVTCDIRTTHISSRRRELRCDMISKVSTPRSSIRITEQLRFRTSSALQVRRLLRRVPEFEPIATSDFSYDLMNPISVGPETPTSLTCCVVSRARRHSRVQHAQYAARHKE